MNFICSNNRDALKRMMKKKFQYYVWLRIKLCGMENERTSRCFTKLDPPFWGVSRNKCFVFVKHPTRIPMENDEHPDSLTITKQKFRHAPPYAYKISTSSRKSKIWSSNLSAAVRQLWRMKRQSTPHKDLISLEDNTFRANRYKNPSSTKNYYLTTKAVEQSDTKAVKRHKRARSVTTLLWM